MKIGFYFKKLEKENQLKSKEIERKAILKMRMYQCYWQQRKTEKLITANNWVFEVNEIGKPLA